MLVSVGESEICSPGVTCISSNRKNLSGNLPQNNEKEREGIEKFLFEWFDLVGLRITTIFSE